MLDYAVILFIQFKLFFINTHTCAQTHTCTHIHTQTQTDTHTHTHTHTHTYIHAILILSLIPKHLPFLACDKHKLSHNALSVS